MEGLIKEKNKEILHLHKLLQSKSEDMENYRESIKSLFSSILVQKEELQRSIMWQHVLQE